MTSKNTLEEARPVKEPILAEKGTRSEARTPSIPISTSPDSTRRIDFSQESREGRQRTSLAVRKSTSRTGSAESDDSGEPLLRNENDCSSRKITPTAQPDSKSAIGEQFYIALVILFFAGSSLGAIFINKACLTGYHFRYPLILMLGQMTFAIVVLTILHASNRKTIPQLKSGDIFLMIVPTLLFTSNVIVGLSALSLVNIPMFSALRRLTLLFVMGAEYVFLKKTHSQAIINLVVIMTFGAFVSALDDVSFSRLGYLLVFLNNLLTALYLASIKRLFAQTKFDPLSLLYYTALMGAPVVVLLIIVTGELNSVVTAFKNQPELLTPGFLISLTLTATGAFAVNYSTSLCTHVTSPLTTSVAGQAKNAVQTLAGFFSWGFVPTRMNVAGLLVALVAQIVFANLKYRENVEAQKSDLPVCAPAATEVDTK